MERTLFVSMISAGSPQMEHANLAIITGTIVLVPRHVVKLCEDGTPVASFY